MAQKRKGNWTGAETACLVDRCTDNHALVSGKFSGEVSTTTKNKFWQETCEMINCIGCCERSQEELTKKWKDMKSQTKKKEQKRRVEMKKTGGGDEKILLKPWEEQIITIMPSAILDGIEGGEDTFKSRVPALTMEKTDTTTQVGDTILIHPVEVNVEVTPEQEERLPMKTKRTSKDLTDAQYNYFCEQTKTAKEKRLTLVAQRRFFEVATDKMLKSEAQALLNFFGEE